MSDSKINEGVMTPSHFPLNTGVSLKPCYFETILSSQPEVGFFEIHAENYLSAGGPNRHYLEKIRHDYPITVHGVGLSIGGESPLDLNHLERIASLVDEIDPIVFSEHLAWSSHESHFYNDLLPLPYTQETLDRVCEHIDQIQMRLQRPILLENPATYLSFSESYYSEIEFINHIVKQTGCQLLLDINNVAVSCFNHDQSPEHYLDHFPIESVKQIHLAGFAVDHNSSIPLRIDSHDREISHDVWQLYQRVLQHQDFPTLIEWDGNLPPFERLHAQARQADAFRAQYRHPTTVR